MAERILSSEPGVALQTEQSRREILGIIARVQAGVGLEEGSPHDRTVRELLALLHAAVDALNQLDAARRSSSRAAS